MNDPLIHIRKVYGYTENGRYGRAAQEVWEGACAPGTQGVIDYVSRNNNNNNATTTTNNAQRTRKGTKHNNAIRIQYNIIKDY